MSHEEAAGRNAGGDATAITVEGPGGRHLEVHAAGEPVGGTRLVLVWHNGSPHSGRLLDPVVAEAAARGIRVITYARPAYGGSSSRPGRLVAEAAEDVEAIAEALGIARFAVAGASGGGPHALACSALLPDRVLAAAAFASPAPFVASDDWFAGMQAPGGLRAAHEGGRSGRAVFAETDAFDPAQFVPADVAMFDGPWAALGRDAEAAEALGPGGLVDDDVAFTRPWGFDPSAIRCPVLLLQGRLDRVIPASHGRALASAIPGAELRLEEPDGHVSILRHLPAALDWLLERAAPSA